MLNVAYKIVTAIVNDRLITRHTETIIGQYQYGFRKRKATTDAVHIPKQIKEKSQDHDRRPRKD